MVAQPKFSNAHWGILIVDPERGDTLYSRNAGKLFMPASNQKIVTGIGGAHAARPGLPVPHGVRRARARGRRRAARRSRRDRPRRSVDERPHARRCHAGAAGPCPTRCARTTFATCRAGCSARGDAFPDAWHGFGWAWDDFDVAYSAGVDELFFNEGMFQVTLRAGQREGARASTSVRPDIGYPSLRSMVTTVRRPDSVRAADGTHARCRRTALSIGVDGQRERTS